MGAWHPSRPLFLTTDPAPSGVSPDLIGGANWALLSNRLSRDGPSLVHEGLARDTRALAFRGYVLEPPLHSWSPARRLLDYWSSRRNVHNGVFAVAQIGDGGRSLFLTTDAFGVSPLYWRRLPNGLVLFSTSARYLRVANDKLDEYSARLFMHRGALAGNASLLDGVERVAPGIAISFHGEKTESVAWFDWSSLPPGIEELTEGHLEAAEQTFKTAVGRCLRLMPDCTNNLPLSSGDDSRRILVELHRRGARFRAKTVRVLQKENRDLDARFAGEMAQRFGFDHEVIELASAEQFGKDDAACRMLFSSEISEHGWIGPLVRGLGAGQSLVFDGVAGDIFGNTGYARPDLYGLPGTEDLERVAELATPDAMSNVLRRGAWVPLADVRRHLATLRVHPTAKLEQTLQARCLQRYWPDYYAVPGSRRFSPELPQQSTEAERNRRVSRIGHLANEAHAGAFASMFARVRLRNAALATLGGLSEGALLRSAWWLEPLLTLEGFRGQRTVSDVG